MSSFLPKQNNETKPMKFEFSDHDDLVHEINELYSYSELTLLKKCDIYNQFTQDLITNTSKNKWSSLDNSERIEYLQVTIGYLELSFKSSTEHYNRYLLKSRILWYIAQGVKDECTDTKSQLQQMKENSQLLRNLNIFPLLLKSLSLISSTLPSFSHKDTQSQSETTDTNNTSSSSTTQHTRGGVKATHLQPPSTTNKTGSKTLSLNVKINSKRADPLMSIILNIIYLILISNQDDKTFQSELMYIDNFDINLQTLLLNLLFEFNDKEENIYPIKKIVLVLWKSMLIGFGGLKDLEKLKEERLKTSVFKISSAKTRPSDINNFLKSTQRYHYQLRDSKIHKVKNDIIRLPPSLSESLSVLQNNLYPPESLKDQLGFNDNLKPRILLSNPSYFEQFYSFNLHNLSKAIVVLLKILLASSPAVKTYSGPINLMTEIVIDTPSPGSSASLVETMQSTIDFLRHKEIISKSTLAILLLLLKHSRYNQNLQFEYISKIMYESNAIVLLYKCLNNETIDKIHYSQNYIVTEEYFPSIDNNSGDQTAERECWRNIFSTICTLRIIQKIIKQHQSRSPISPIKSSNILKKYCIIKQHDLKYYSLKIIKSLLPYLSKKWRQTNMRIVSDIYIEVPIHINDPWLSIQSELLPHESNAIEYHLQEKIEEYHKNNYENWQQSKNVDKQDLIYSIDNLSLIGSLLNSIELTNEELEQSSSDLYDNISQGESSIYWANDNAEDKLLFEKWDVQKPSFSNFKIN
ncbi:FAM40 family protein [Tieghemostelium lacteum]|uniref:FAM40 family protein n=1 Tax=Tieghemostelium lacteum TaxID=361077 RepID=A0A151ZKJ2_TIELA|nr:FAM40 family protein [Tieghemostelium lacteum]|eukprot:KYQ94466.1 FAM40 family protein [Tieghemostelium lacteum]